MLENNKKGKKQLFEQISIDLKKDGFIGKFGEQGFYRKTSFGNLGYHLGFRDRVYGFDTMVDVAVRFDEVEDIVNYYPMNPILKEKERKKTFTLGTTFPSGGSPPIWEVEFEEEIPVAANSIVRFFRDKGALFLTKNSTLEDIFETLINDPLKGTRALAVAYLLRDEASFLRIAREQRVRLKSQHESWQRKFEILETELRNRWFGETASKSAL